MANMTYCIFENTAQDLSQAFSKLEDIMGGDLTLGMSENETTAAHRLVRLAFEITQFMAEATADTLIHNPDGSTAKQWKALRMIAEADAADILHTFNLGIESAMAGGTEFDI